MLFAIGLLIVIVYVSFRIAPVEKEEHAHIHGAGQIGLLAALALFGVDYFTSYFYATGEMMSALTSLWVAKVRLYRRACDCVCQCQYLDSFICIRWAFSMKAAVRIRLPCAISYPG